MLLPERTNVPPPHLLNAPPPLMFPLAVTVMAEGVMKLSSPTVELKATLPGNEPALVELSPICSVPAETSVGPL